MRLTKTKRRAFLKTSIAAAASAPVILTSRKSAAQVILPPSPTTVPWVEVLPDAVTPIQPLASLSPAPNESANQSGGEVGRAKHQRFYELTTKRPPDLYEMRARENPSWSFNPAYPLQPIWGYAPTLPDGSVGATTSPGPTFFARYGRPIICRLRNELPQNHVGFGSPEISTHLHNLHVPSESDGFPGDFWSPYKAGPTLAGPGFFKDNFFPNIYAGLDEFGDIGDPREALGTLWYHDHTMDFTAPNVYRGLAGFYLIYDDLDSGNENDPNPNALRLPSHPYDYPLIFADRRFDSNGRLFYDQVNPEGILGDKVVVNGKIEPVLRVARRKYRLRLLNGGPSRYYQFYLVTPGNSVQSFTYIANDGNLLPAPLLNQTNVRLAPAERGDIVVDFSRYPAGTELYLVNRIRQEKTRGPKDIKTPGTRVLKIIVGQNAADPSRVPSTLRALRTITPDEIAAAPVRRWEFERSNGMWVVNDRQFNVNSPRATMKRGSAEIWELVNPEDGWEHPVHIHFEEGRIISKTIRGTSVPVPVHERGRKDTYNLEPFATLRVFLRFRDFTGKYPMHCHNLIHEDHAMMVRFDIVP